MAHLIDKDALLAEIDNLLKPVKQRLERDKNNPWNSDIALYKFGVQLIKTINTLEVREVDLDFTKEVDMYIRDNGDTNGFFNVEELAKHFFELGLNSSNPLTWEDINSILYIERLLRVFGGQKHSNEELCREVLKQFKEQKEEKV